MKLWITLLFSASAFASCDKKEKGLPKQKPTDIITMSCQIDQYKVAKSGWHLPTYLRCINSQKDYYLYMLVPQHSISNSIPVESVASPVQLPDPVLIPEVKPELPEMEDNGNDPH